MRRCSSISKSSFSFFIRLSSSKSFKARSRDFSNSFTRSSAVSPSSYRARSSSLARSRARSAVATVYCLSASCNASSRVSASLAALDASFSDGTKKVITAAAARVKPSTIVATTPASALNTFLIAVTTGDSRCNAADNFVPASSFLWKASRSCRNTATTAATAADIHPSGVVSIALLKAFN